MDAARLRIPFGEGGTFCFETWSYCVTMAGLELAM